MKLITGADIRIISSTRSCALMGLDNNWADKRG
jgi:hypothetical protein